ncbi:phage tail tape measure protein [Leucobacter viscericola]|uniref:Phage tail tape measure protein n=1 Tax=Leucobacter viscericola TaxID=2714935 RepID=A0A6G7XBF6_9MICO|nr:phage tail tape measure protein [Leucobacter viscericola]QIK61796.1 phage tail tape measure protein [Leucobacter viscericola]QIK64578.1 phage tail tape measure protein [Leucobacter viscericola]
MSENFNAQGEISLSISGIDDLEALITAVGAYNRETGGTDEAIERLERNLNRQARSARETAQAMSAGASDLAKYAAGFAELVQQADLATDAIRAVAQAQTGAGGSGNASQISAQAMTLQEAQRIIQIREAEGVTAEQVARKVITAEEKKRAAALETYQTLQRENEAWAKRYQEGFTDPKSFMGQANSRDSSAGLRASESIWAVEAKEISGLNLQYDAHVKSFDRVMAEKSTASQQTALYNQYLYDQERATRQANSATNEATVALPRLRYALYDVATTAGIMNAAIGASGAAVLAASASYESSFTTVERTTGLVGDGATRMRDELLQLTREIPQTFGEISNITGRGAQLGVATSSLADFTETVAQFVATSDTVTLDQAVESLGRISNLMGDTDFNRIGSSITLVGVNAAATESQIIKTSQELAPFGTSAGFATHEVIGLAAALGSLGQPPERARSAFLSLQSVMDKAIGGINDKLPVFAQLLGLSADETARLWQQDPSQFVTSFVRALGNVDNMTVALSDLGLSEKRSSQVFQALASDSRNAGEGLSVLEQALADASQGYSEGTELGRQYGLIVDDLASKWQIFLNSIMETTAAVGDALAPAAKAALDIITPLVQQFAIFARSAGGKWAIGIAATLAGIAFGLTGIVATGALAMASVAAMGTATAELSAAGVGSIFTLRGMSSAFSSVAAAAGLSTRAVSVFKVTLASTGIGLIVLALGTLAAAFMQAGDSAEMAFDKYVGTTAGLTEALAADKEAYSQAVAEGNNAVADSFLHLQPNVDLATGSLETNNQALSDTASVLGLAAPAYGSATGAVEGFTVALGENTLAWAQNTLMASEEFQKLASSNQFAETWAAMGGNFNEVLNIAATQGQTGVRDYFIRLANQTGQSANVYAKGTEGIFQSLARVIFNAGGFISGALDSLGQLWGSKLSTLQKFLWSGMTAITGGLRGAGSLDPLKDNFRDFNGVVNGVINQVKTVGGEANRAGNGFAEGAEGVDNFTDSVDDAGGASEKAAKKIYTLANYASDLASIWGRAFEIRFSGQSTLDQVTSAWIKMKKAAEDSADAIAKYRAEMASLNADKTTLQYWLMVAENYGDSIRAAELRAKIGETDVKIAETKKKLTAEQEKNNKTLVGNSEAAVNNRKTITDLVKSYRDHIESLAASGMSSEDLKKKTDELKRKFIEQATQLGFSRTEISKYAKSFDDVKFAIDKIPRNITVTANTNPAIQAFNEFKAKADAATSSMTKLRSAASKPIPGGAFNSLSGEAASASVRTEAMIQLMSLVPRVAKAIADRDVMALAVLVPQAAHWQVRAARGWKAGGYTGDGGTGEVAGVVHGKEFVFSAPAVANLGVGNLARLHESAKSGRVGGNGNGGGLGAGPMEVELSPTDRQLLVDVRQAVGISLDGGAMQRFFGAGAVNSGRTGQG